MVLELGSRSVGNQHLDVVIAELSTRQHGVVSRSQLHAAGISDTVIRWRIARSRLHRLHPGIYAVGHAAPSRRGRIRAAALYAGPESAIARRTALELLRVWRQSERPIDVVVVKRTRSIDGIDVHHSRVLPPEHVLVMDDVRITTPARTLLDLCLELDALQIANVIHEMKYRKIYDRADFRRCIERLQASHGCPVALAALEMERIGSAGTKSELERRVRALLLELGLAEPLSNVPVRTPLGWVELDNCWPELKVYLEVDGPPHARSRTKNADRDKRIGLKHAGWTEVRVGYLELDLNRAGVSAKLLAKLPPAS